MLYKFSIYWIWGNILKFFALNPFILEGGILMSNELSEFTTLETGFEYLIIPDAFTKAEIKKYCENIRFKFNSVTKDWSSELNHEWVLRSYISVKLMLSSTLMINSLDYSISKNIRIVEPYLTYYCLHNCSRAFLLTLPTELWKEGRLIRSPHSRVIKVLADAVKHFSEPMGNSVESLLYKAKDYRELFSYRFPASGIDGIPTDERVTIQECEYYSRLICEIAQMHSEILQVSLESNVKDNQYKLDISFFRNFIRQEYLNKVFDSDDNYRLGYICRKVGQPYNLYWLVTEGLVEDFFGAWYPNDEEKSDSIDDLGLFNPDKKWHRLLSPL